MTSGLIRVWRFVQPQFPLCGDVNEDRSRQKGTEIAPTLLTGRSGALGAGRDVQFVEKQEDLGGQGMAWKVISQISCLDLLRAYEHLRE